MVTSDHAERTQAHAKSGLKPVPITIGEHAKVKSSPPKKYVMVSTTTVMAQPMMGTYVLQTKSAMVWQAVS